MWLQSEWTLGQPDNRRVPASCFKGGLRAAFSFRRAFPHARG